MIDGRVLWTEVYPDAGWPGFAWHVVVKRKSGETEAWTTTRSYETRSGAKRAMLRWCKSRSEHGTLKMCGVPERPEKIEVLGSLGSAGIVDVGDGQPAQVDADAPEG